MAKSSGAASKRAAEKSKSTGLKVGDRIRIVAVPGEGIPGYVIDRDTVRVYRMLVARGTPVRISFIDEYDQPWYYCRFRKKNGRNEWHSLGIQADDDNWVSVKPRRR